jgi:Fur family ferric uptake transcriptional regulator
MKLFAEAGVAHERHFQDGQTRYEPVVPDEHHDHLICTTCGHIFEFEDPVVEARQAEVAAQHGLRVVSHRHEIYGACQAPQTCPRNVNRN